MEPETGDEPGAAVDEAEGSGIGIVVSIVIVLILGAMLGYIVYRRKQANNGTLNEGGMTQRYENPAYDDGSSSYDGKDNLKIVIESAATASAGAAGKGGSAAAPRKRGSFRKAKRDKEGVNMAVSDTPRGLPEWADPMVPFLSRDEAEKELEANGNVNASFVVRQTRSVVRGYVVTSVFDGNVTNSQLKNKGGGYYHGTKEIGGTLEEALEALHTAVQISSIGGIEPYLLVDRISLPAPPAPVAAPASESSVGRGEKKKKKKKTKKLSPSAGVVNTDFGEEKKKNTANNKTVVAATKPAANAETAFDSDDGFDIDNFFGKMVTAGDADGDGMVSLEEAIALGMDTSTFNDIDADGNGQLTNAEVTMWSENNVGGAVGMLNEDGDFEC